jgi:hypothetical protein
VLVYVAGTYSSVRCPDSGHSCARVSRTLQPVECVAPWNTRKHVVVSESTGSVSRRSRARALCEALQQACGAPLVSHAQLSGGLTLQ